VAHARLPLHLDHHRIQLIRIDRVETSLATISRLIVADFDDLDIRTGYLASSIFSTRWSRMSGQRLGGDRQLEIIGRFRKLFS